MDGAASMEQSEENAALVRNGRSFSLDYNAVELDSTGRLRRFTPLANLASGLIKPKVYSKLTLHSEQKKMILKDETFETPSQNVLAKYRRSFPTIKYSSNLQTSRIDELEAENIPRPIPLTKFAPGPASLWTLKIENVKRSSTAPDMSPLLLIDVPFFGSDNDFSSRGSTSLVSLMENKPANLTKEYQIERNSYIII